MEHANNAIDFLMVMSAIMFEGAEFTEYLPTQIFCSQFACQCAGNV